MYYEIDLSAPLEVTRIGRIRYTDNWNLRGSRSGHHRFVFVLDGKIIYTVNDRRFYLEKGDCILIPKGAVYASDIENSCEFYYLHFAPCRLRQVSDEQYDDLQHRRTALFNARPALPYGRFHPSVDHLLYLPDVVSTSKYFDELKVICAKCESFSFLASPDSKFGLNLLFMQFILRLRGIVTNHPQGDSLPPNLQKITEYIRLNYTDHITLSTLADHFSLSKQYIMRLFSTYLSTSVTKYINVTRLERSLDLLRHSSLNISEIASFLGFGSVYYFSRLFRSVYHMTPSEYAGGKNIEE